MLIFLPLPRGHTTIGSSPPYLATWHQIKLILLAHLLISAALFDLALWHHYLHTYGDFWSGLPALASVAYVFCAVAAYLLGARPVGSFLEVREGGSVSICYERVRLFLHLSLLVGFAGTIAFVTFGLTRYGGTINAIPLYVGAILCAILAGITIWRFPKDPTRTEEDIGSDYHLQQPGPKRSHPVVVGEAV